MKNIVINKSMDRSDLDCLPSRKIISELNNLIIDFSINNLNISSWYGSFNLEPDYALIEIINRGYNYNALSGTVDDARFPWFLYWEIAWIVQHSNFEKEQKILDLGGSSSLFSFYLASKGFDVTTIDSNPVLVENAEHVAKITGWKLKNHVMDMRNIQLDTQFDHITSICVFEHIPMYERIEINKSIAKLLATNGRFSITFDYRNPSMLAKINTPKDVDEQFIQPSGLVPRGNKIFYDNGHSYLLHPFYHKDVPDKYKQEQTRQGHFNTSEHFVIKYENDYTFGALFLENK